MNKERLADGPNIISLYFSNEWPNCQIAEQWSESYHLFPESSVPDSDPVLLMWNWVAFFSNPIFNLLCVEST